MTTYGPPIPHNPHSYTAKDGTFYPAVCPWPDEPGMVKLLHERDFCRIDRLGGLIWREWGLGSITSYRLRADHPVYTRPKVSRMGREPDLWVNEYAGWFGARWKAREDADNYCVTDDQRIGIWRIYLKPQPAHNGS